MDKLKIDNDWLGVGIALLFPSLVYGLAMAIKTTTHHMVTTPFLLIVCVSSNFIPVYFYSRNDLNKTTRGIVLVTVLLGLLFFYYRLFIVGD